MILTERLKTFREVERVILFGSRARRAGFRANIDIAVECPRADARCWSDIEEAVENAPTLLKIDLVLLDTVSPELAAAIRDEGRIRYERSKRKTSA